MVHWAGMKHEATTALCRVNTSQGVFNISDDDITVLDDLTDFIDDIAPFLDFEQETTHTTC